MASGVNNAVPVSAVADAGYGDGLWPMARWERDSAEPLTLEVIVQRVAEGETLKEICRSRGWPKSFVWKWICADDERRAAYDDALKCWADELAQATVQIADDALPEEVAKAKLQVDTRLRVAAQWDRERYGQAKKAESAGLTVVLSPELEVKASELLSAALARRRLTPSNVIDHESQSVVQVQPVAVPEFIGGVI